MSAPAAAPALPESALSLPLRMKRFIDERFPLQLHGVSILMFFLTNAAVAQAATRPAGEPVLFGPRSIVAAAGLGLMFLRLRLFDEVKDYEHDKVHNPHRPLPRGLLTVREMHAWAGISTAVEAAIAAALGWGAFTGFVAVLVFTLLMRFEFFMRDVIRPRLLTYAVLHTPSGGLIGLFVYCAVTGRPVWDVPRPMAFYAIAGWTLLMVFELARKTKDPKTEPSADTYSTVFGARGAAALNALFLVASTVLIHLAVIDALDSPARIFALMLWGLTAIALSVTFAYALSPGRLSARNLRLAASLYLALAGMLAAGQILISRGLGLAARA